ncbi:hypothetical protein GH714_034300 [Hevea brasiliensis]|uniref:Uncharacterized protein n=1 Tax=Hevea brasiliensis TaxID=3981 RepID=A0A6A6MF78_HEVBR|nr:hypothetical protein GH714_034300 [Hevea brasiliensis]
MEVHMGDPISCPKSQTIPIRFPQNLQFHCKDLKVWLNLLQSQLLLTWIGEDTEKVSLRVPIPKVLIDPDSPVSFRALDYHIEVKLVLLLPVDHLIFSNFSLSDDRENNEVLDSVKPLNTDSAKLISYVDISWKCHQLTGERWLTIGLELAVVHLSEKLVNREEEPTANGLFSVPSASDLSENVALKLGCCHSTYYALDYVEVSTHKVSKLSLADQTKNKAVKAMENRRSFLNGFLGDVFMARSYNLSMDIEWKQFVCPQCSTVLGAYPCADGDIPVDDGDRF